MKKLFAIALIFLFTFTQRTISKASDTTLTDSELSNLRDSIKIELLAKIESLELEDITGKTLAEIFPDEILAKVVRDRLSMKSIHDVPTKEQLETVTTIDSGEPLSSLAGIGHLTNLKELYIGLDDKVEVLPLELFTLKNISVIYCHAKTITSIPDEIGLLENLEYLLLSYTGIDSIPESIVNLEKLKYFDISYTNVTSIPDVIFNLKLESFKREGLKLDTE